MNSELQDQLTHYLPFVASTALVVGGFIAFRKWAAGGVCTDRVNLSGKTVIITGANTGIGLTAAKMLAKMNGHIILACRDVEKGKKAREKILKEFDKASVEVMKLDLSSLKSVREFAEEFKNKKISLDILINNAGIMNAPKGKTADGFELHIGINHLGHFLLTNLLLDKLVQSKGRIVTVSSSLHKRGNVNLHDLQWETTPYNGRQAYSASKSANILFTIELQRRLEGSGVEAFVLHPGVVGTELGRYASLRARYTFALLVRIFGKTAEQGCQTTVYAAISPSLNGKGGAYLGDCRIEEAAHHALDMETAKKLWEISEKLVNLKQ